MRWTFALAMVLVACASASDVGSETTVTDTVAVTDAVAITAADENGTSDSSSGDGPTTSEPPAIRPEGFATTSAMVTNSDGTTCEICVWLADDSDRRAQGLMFVTDLGMPEAMAFRYPDPHTGSFWMKNTVMPLSIAFFSPEGDFLDSFDMEPCTSDPCRKYPTAPDFLVAIEVPQGELEGLGLLPGSSLELLDLPCDG